MLKILMFVCACCLFLPACVQAKVPESQNKSTEQRDRIDLDMNSPDLHSLKLAGLTVLVELACTDPEQQKGLMFRKELSQDQGMLFVFERESRLSFWMKNTYVPLSVAYIDAAGKIVDIQKMQPLDESPRPANAPAQYALEMNQGWFETHAIQVGDSMQIEHFCSTP